MSSFCKWYFAKMLGGIFTCPLERNLTCGITNLQLMSKDRSVHELTAQFLPLFSADSADGTINDTVEGLGINIAVTSLYLTNYFKEMLFRPFLMLIRRYVTFPKKSREEYQRVQLSKNFSTVSKSASIGSGIVIVLRTA
jgi:hypothetical protein